MRFIVEESFWRLFPDASIGIAAVKELTELVHKYLGGSQQIFFMDSSNKEIYFN